MARALVSAWIVASFVPGTQTATTEVFVTCTWYSSITVGAAAVAVAVQYQTTKA